MKKINRTAEFSLGLVGGIVGAVVAVLAILMGGAEATVNEIENSSIVAFGWAAVFLSFVGIGGSIIVRNKPKLGGMLMLIAAIGGFFCIYMFYVMPGVLLAIAGLSGLFRKDPV